MALKKYILSVLWFILICFGLYRVTQHTQDSATRDYRLLESPPLSHLSTPFLNIITLGHRGLYDDFMAIWMIQILLDPKVRLESAEKLQKSILQMTKHHPKIESIYLLSCFTLAMDFRRPELCKALLQDGMAALPLSWRLPVTQGFIYYYYFHDFKKAALYFGMTATKKDSPPFIARLAAKLAKNSNLNPSEMNDSINAILPTDRLRKEVINIINRQNPPNDPSKTTEISPMGDIP